MPITIKESKFCSIYFNEEENLYEQYWHEASQDMTEEEYKKIHLDWVQELIKHKYDIQYFYLDNRLNFFTMSPELQEWHAENITTPVIKHLKEPEKIKVAILASGDFISQLAIEQTFEENDHANSMSRYFDDESEALEWLLNS